MRSFFFAAHWHNSKLFDYHVPVQNQRIIRFIFHQSKSEKDQRHHSIYNLMINRLYFKSQHLCFKGLIEASED